MKKKIYSIILIILFSFIIVGALFYNSLNKEQKIEFIGERNIITLKKIEEINLKDNYAELKFFDNDMFLVSWEEKNQGKLFKYNNEKKTIDIYKDFNIFNKKDEKNIIGEYYIKNVNDSLIFFYKNNATNSFKSIYNNKLLYDKEFKIMIQRIFFKNNENSIVTTWNIKSFKPEYYKYNLKEEKFTKIAFDYDLIKEIKFPGVALDGIFSSNGEQIFLTSYAQNLVFLFDNNLNYTGYFNLNYRNPTFNILRTEENKIPVIDPNNRLPNISVDVDDEFYYVLTNEKGIREGAGIYFIDRYNLKNKKYDQSLQINVEEHDLSPKEIKVHNNKLYVLTKKNITIYEKNRF